MEMVFYYSETHQYRKALALTDSLNAMKGISSLYDKIRIQNNYLMVYLRENDLKKAKLRVSKILQLIKSLSPDDDIRSLPIRI
jgi:hypothetical protein